MSAHTPGPWRLVTYPERFVLRSSRRVLRDESDIGLIELGPEANPFENGQADARLIAAAPDLLGALKVAREVIHAPHPEYGGAPCQCGSCRALPVVEAAIAKAEGTS